MQHGELPEGLVLQRTTGALDAGSVPGGLLRAHRLAPDVWGRLQVVSGSLTFVWEDRPDSSVRLGPGDSLVIPPETLHHVELGPGARFSVEFHR